MKISKIESSYPVAAISALFLFAFSASAGTYYVSHSGAGGNPGTEDSPVDTIAAALALCTSGDDEIVIEKSDAPYFADDLVVSKKVVIRSATGIPEDVVVTPTTGTKKRVFQLNHADATLKGLTVSGGTISGGDVRGANVLVGSNGGIVENCIIRNGANNGEMSSKGSGGAIALQGPGRVSNCVITNNVAGKLNDCGAVCIMGDGLVENCFVAWNSTAGNMAGKEIDGSGITARKGTVVNCTICQNRGVWSAGVYAANDCKGVYNCLIYDNEGSMGGRDGVRDVYTGVTDKFHNCAARVKINDTCVAVPYLSSRDEMLRPVAGSPLAGAGVVVDAAVSTKDLDGNARTDGDLIDIGCFQFSTSPAAQPSVGMTISKLATLKSAGEVIAFSAHGNVDGIPEWDFGDGVTDTGLDVSHVYTACGKYYPTVTVGGVSYTAKKPVVVLPDTMHVVLNNANAAWPYETEETAAAKVIDALDAAVASGIEIVVANGTYQSTKTPIFKYGVTVRGASGNPADVTIKSPGNNNIRGPFLDHEDARLLGVTVEGGVEDGGWGHVAYGIGIYLVNGGGTVSNCVVKNVKPSGRQFSAVHVRNGKGLVTHTKMTGCVTGESNDIGILYLQGGGRADNCLLVGNKTAGGQYSTKGGTVVMDGSDDNLLRNCTIVGNAMARFGGALVSKGRVVNCVFANNSASQSTYKNFVAGQESRYDHCASDDAAKINDTCLIGTADSMFADYAAGDYTPKAGGPLMNTGDNPEEPEATDFVGFTRISGGTIDIGAYEADAETFDFEILADVKAALAPATITYTAGLTGTNGTDVYRCYWFFDGTGKVNVESENAASWTYGSFGASGVGLIVSNLTVGTGMGKVTGSDFVKILPKTMYVVAKNENAAWPYDNLGNAAATLADALNAAIDKCEIVLSNGVHLVSKPPMTIGKELCIRGLTGRPEDATVRISADVSGAQNYMIYIDNAKAVLRDLTVRGNDRYCNVKIDAHGGTVSNCVITGGCAADHWHLGAAVHVLNENGLLTHCVITNNAITYAGTAKGIVFGEGLGARISNCLLTRNRVAIRSGENPLKSAGILTSYGDVDNCTVVSNATNAGEYHFASLYDSRFPDKHGSACNCIVANNSIVADTVGTGGVKADSFLRNFLTDGEEPVGVNGYVAPASEIFADVEAQDWHLSARALKTAINRGLNDFGKDLPAGDLDGNPRKSGPRVDIGCYESPIQPGLIMLVR